MDGEGLTLTPHVFAFENFQEKPCALPLPEYQAMLVTLHVFATQLTLLLMHTPAGC